jgi:hypothetical protein
VTNGSIFILSMGPALQPSSGIDLENFLRRTNDSRVTQDSVDAVADDLICCYLQAVVKAPRDGARRPVFAGRQTTRHGFSFHVRWTGTALRTAS